MSHPRTVEARATCAARASRAARRPQRSRVPRTRARPTRDTVHAQVYAAMKHALMRGRYQARAEDHDPRRRRGARHQRDARARSDSASCGGGRARAPAQRNRAVAGARSRALVRDHRSARRARIARRAARGAAHDRRRDRRVSRPSRSSSRRRAIARITTTYLAKQRGVPLRLLPRCADAEPAARDRVDVAAGGSLPHAAAARACAASTCMRQPSRRRGGTMAGRRSRHRRGHPACRRTAGDARPR